MGSSELLSSPLCSPDAPRTQPASAPRCGAARACVRFTRLTLLVPFLIIHSHSFSRCYDSGTEYNLLAQAANMQREMLFHATVEQTAELMARCGDGR